MHYESVKENYPNKLYKDLSLELVLHDVGLLVDKAEDVAGKKGYQLAVIH